MAAHEMRMMKTLMGTYNGHKTGFQLSHLRWDKEKQMATLWIQPLGCEETFTLGFETLESFTARFPEATYTTIQ